MERITLKTASASYSYDGCGRFMAYGFFGVGKMDTAVR